MDGRQDFAGGDGVEHRAVRPRVKLAAAAVCAAVVLWGVSPVGTRYLVGAGLAHLPALAFNGLRYTIAAIMFLPLLRGVRGWSRGDLWRGAALGLIGVAGYSVPSTLGQRTVSAGLTGLLNGAEPVMIVLLGAALRRAWPKRWALPAALLGLLGIVLLAVGGGPALGDAKGIALALTGALLWSLYCVLAPGLIARRGALPVTALMTGCGAVPMLLAGLPRMGELLGLMTGFDWGLLLALTLGTTMLSLLLWNAGSAVLGADRAGWFLYLIPLVSLLGGVVFLGEPVRWVEVVGGGLILASVFLSQR